MEQGNNVTITVQSKDTCASLHVTDSMPWDELVYLFKQRLLPALGYVLKPEDLDEG